MTSSVSPDTTDQQLHTMTRAAWIVAAVVLVFILWRHLLPALLAGLLIHELVYMLAPYIMQFARIKRRPAKMAVVAFLTVVVMALLALLLFAIIHFFWGGQETLPGLLHKMAEIIETSRKSMPLWVAENIPADIDDLKEQIVAWLHSHAGEIQAITKETGRVVVHILIGMIIGAMVALYEAKGEVNKGLLARALSERASLLAQSFRQVVFAQVRIAAINTVFTAIYLLVILPLLGVKLPYLLTMILLTFLFGLLPVIGNIISNTIIVIVSMSHSLLIAGSSLTFLIVIHKLEYFLNAKIIGSRIQTRAWEILLSMLLLETAFGVTGVIAAPIYYAYLKKELKKKGLV